MRRTALSNLLYISVVESMRVFQGCVTAGYGMATRNLEPVMDLIETRTGLTNLARGTLNAKISEEYIVRAEALILPEEYPYNRESNLGETIKLQRCLVAGYKALIVRPDSHELGSGQFHGKAHFELMSQQHFRTVLGVKNGSLVEIQVEGDDRWWRSGK